MYGIGAYFAIRNAVKAFTDCSPAFDLPFTPEKVLMNLYDSDALTKNGEKLVADKRR